METEVFHDMIVALLECLVCITNQHTSIWLEQKSIAYPDCWPQTLPEEHMYWFHMIRYWLDSVEDLMKRRRQMPPTVMVEIILVIDVWTASLWKYNLPFTLSIALRQVVSPQTLILLSCLLIFKFNLNVQVFSKFYDHSRNVKMH